MRCGAGTTIVRSPGDRALAQASIGYVVVKRLSDGVGSGRRGASSEHVGAWFRLNSVSPCFPTTRVLFYARTRPVPMVHVAWRTHPRGCAAGAGPSRCRTSCHGSSCPSLGCRRIGRWVVGDAIGDSPQHWTSIASAVPPSGAAPALPAAQPQRVALLLLRHVLFDRRVICAATAGALVFGHRVGHCGGDGHRYCSSNVGKVPSVMYARSRFIIVSQFK